MEITKEVKERVFIIGLYTGKESKEEYERTVDELEHLSKTAGAKVCGRFIQNLEKPNSGTYIGKGKIEEISQKANEEDIDTLIFNDNLSPAQAKNIAKLTERNIVDRTELILDIFASHAKTKQAKMQVELAMLQYNYSKLRNLWQHFSRIEGGIGLRGPGETQIEIDRREIQKKITILKDRIKEIEKNATIKRKKRTLLNNVSLVGYTNAGKSTLFNRLTGEQKYVANQLFATLDSTARALFIDKNEKIILSDTIGFIKKLPHTLVSSFHSTLLEVTEADLLMHVVDVSDPDCISYIESVNEVLKEIEADNKDVLYVFNKQDILPNDVKSKFFKKNLILQYPNSVFISAKDDNNFDQLITFILKYIRESRKEKLLRVPYKMRKLIAYIEEHTEVLERSYDEQKNDYIFRVKASSELLKSLQKQIDDFLCEQYINK